VTSDYTSAQGASRGHFAHCDCDTVCNLLFVCNFVMLSMTMSIDCAIVFLSLHKNKLLLITLALIFPGS